MAKKTKRSTKAAARVRPVRDLEPTRNPRGGIVAPLSGAAPLPRAPSTSVQSSLPPLNAKGNNVGIESLTLAVEPFDPDK